MGDKMMQQMLLRKYQFYNFSYLWQCLGSMHYPEKELFA
jgi:hypothetical protein